MPEDAGESRINAGDVLFNNTNSPALIGKTAYFSSPGEFAFSNHMTRVVLYAPVDARFLAYQLHWLWMTGYFRHRCINHVNQASIATGTLARTVPVVFPAIDEQRQIVAAVEQLFSRIDAVEADLQRLRVQTAALEGRLLDGLAGAMGPPRALESVVAPGRKIAYGVLQPGPHIDDGLPIVRVGDIERGDVELAALKRIGKSVAAKYPRTTLRGGEVLLTIVGTIGRSAVAPAALAGANTARAVAVIPVGEDVIPEYVASILNAPLNRARLTALAHEVARKTLNLEDVKRFIIPVPPVSTQRDLLDDLAARSSRSSAMSRATVSAQVRLNRLRTAILGRAFNGKLADRSVRLLNPTDLAQVG